MSIKLMSGVWESPLAATARFVLMALADHANDQGTNCFPGMRSLAQKTQLGIRQLQRTIRSLEAAGYLSVESSRYGRSHRRHFILNVHKLLGERASSTTPFSANGGRKGVIVKTPFQEERASCGTLKGVMQGLQNSATPSEDSNLQVLTVINHQEKELPPASQAASPRPIELTERQRLIRVGRYDLLSVPESILTHDCV